MVRADSTTKTGIENASQNLIIDELLKQKRRYSQVFNAVSSIYIVLLLDVIIGCWTKT